STLAVASAATPQARQLLPAPKWAVAAPVAECGVPEVSVVAAPVAGATAGEDQAREARPRTILRPSASAGGPARLRTSTARSVDQTDRISIVTDGVLSGLRFPMNAKEHSSQCVEPA